MRHETHRGDGYWLVLVSTLQMTSAAPSHQISETIPQDRCQSHHLDVTPFAIFLTNTNLATVRLWWLHFIRSVWWPSYRDVIALRRESLPVVKDLHFLAVFCSPTVLLLASVGRSVSMWRRCHVIECQPVLGAVSSLYIRSLRRVSVFEQIYCFIKQQPVVVRLRQRQRLEPQEFAGWHHYWRHRNLYGLSRWCWKKFTLLCCFTAWLPYSHKRCGSDSM